mmetsp:Transcript_21740/g.40670  ORF Transcript_21740/g.40670 Transcript_21740/m.40670 type:complete len:334 (+) Transcript_21740:2106-3107(+)
MTKGKRPSGVRNYVNRTTPSIPSRYQTALNLEPGPPPAFGKSCERFDTRLLVTPGPGWYNAPSGAVSKKVTSSCSLSKKGYGNGFISKATRFKRPEDGDAAWLPGPGYYDLASTSRSTNRGTGACRFSRAQSAKPSANDDLPAPGDYDLQAAIEPRYKSKTKSSAFCSKTRRGLKIDVHGPAPGQYLCESVPERGSRTSKGAPSAFRSGTKRCDTLNPKHLRTTPGPGSYISLRSGLGASQRPSTAPSCMFARTDQDRFGTPVVRKAKHVPVPGPGTYAARLPSKRTGAPAFGPLQASKRRGPQHVAVPGPAAYQPATLSKKSYLLNVEKKWV